MAVASMLNWHAIQFSTRKHEHALESLTAKGFEPVLPLIQVRRKFSETTRTYTEPFFRGFIGGYGFALFDPETSMRSVRWSRGVDAVPQFGDVLPPAVPVELIEAIRIRMDANGFIRLDSQYRKGDKVVIIGGAFEGLPAIFQAETDNGTRAMILLNFLGREHYKSVDLLHLEAAVA